MSYSAHNLEQEFHSKAGGMKTVALTPGNIYEVIFFVKLFSHYQLRQ